jgi:hypothetical protein
VFSYAVYAQFSIQLPPAKVPGLKWKNSYSFDRSNKMTVDFYSKNNRLERSIDYELCYQSEGSDFSIQMKPKSAGTRTESIVDKENQVVVMVYGSAENRMYNTAKYKIPEGNDLKLVELVETNESKQILGYDCKKYTFEIKNVTAELWITDQLDMSNDLGVYRVSKMSMFHNKSDLGGFVLESKSQKKNGAVTHVQTVSLNNTIQYDINLEGVKMGTSINKVSYFSF